MTTYLIKSLIEYKKKRRISDRKLAVLLGVHRNSVYAWCTLEHNPGSLARAKIQQFLIKNL